VTICLTSGNSAYTQANNGALDASGTPDPTCSDAVTRNYSFTSSGPVTPVSTSTLNGATFRNWCIDYNLEDN
jgi:hypothetical protein